MSIRTADEVISSLLDSQELRGTRLGEPGRPAPPRYPELTAAFNNYNNRTGTVGFIEALELLKRRAYCQAGDVFLSMTHRKHKRISNYHWFFTDHLLRMPVRFAVAFLEEKKGTYGMTLRESVRGVFPWAPVSQNDGQFWISEALSRSTSGGDVRWPLLCDMERVWFSAGKKGRFLAMVALLRHCRDVCSPEGENSLFHEVILYAEASGALEAMRNAMVGASISLLLRCEDWDDVKRTSGVLLSCMRLLDLSAAHFETTALQERATIVHCPMTVELQAYCYPLLKKDAFSMQTTTHLHPAEYWLASRRICRSPQWLAALRGLLDAGATVRFDSPQGRMPPVASAVRYAGLMELLVEYGADATAVHCGRHALHWFAYLSGSAVRALVEAGLDPNDPGPIETPPIVSGTKVREPFPHNVDALIAMIECGCDVNATDAQGKTALMHAAGEEIEVLLRAGADPLAYNSKGWTPLITAIFCVGLGLPHEALCVGDNLTRVCFSTHWDHLTSTALGWAVACNGNNGLLVEFLIQAGAQIDGIPEYLSGPRPSDYLPPLLCLPKAGHEMSPAIRVLAAHGARLPADFRERFPVRKDVADALEEYFSSLVGSLTKRA